MNTTIYVIQQLKWNKSKLGLVNYIEQNVNSNDKGPKFQVGGPVRISKYKNNFAKGYTSNWSEEIFLITKVKNIVPWTYIVKDLHGEKNIGGNFMK